MQASGMVDCEVGLSYFCKYLLRFGTWDWAVAKHIKDHITRTPGFIRSRARPGQSASWPDLNEPNLRPSWNVFSHILCSLFESRPPLFLHLCCSSSLPQNCMAWPNPINSFIKTSGGRESGVEGDHNKHWFFLFYFAFSPSVLRCKFIPIIQALLSLLWNPCPPEDVMNKVGVGTNLQPICFIPLGGACVLQEGFLFPLCLCWSGYPAGVAENPRTEIKNCFRSKLETCVSASMKILHDVDLISSVNNKTQSFNNKQTNKQKKLVLHEIPHWALLCCCKLMGLRSDCGTCTPGSLLACFFLLDCVLRLFFLFWTLCVTLSKGSCVL